MLNTGIPMSTNITLPTEIWENKDSVTLISDRAGVHVMLTYQVQRSLLDSRKRILIQAVTSADTQEWDYKSVREAEKKWKELTRPIVQLNA